MIRNLLYRNIIVFLVLLSNIAISQSLKVSKLPDIIDMSSGIEMTSGGNIWTINDHRAKVLYQLDTDSFTIKRTIHLNHKKRDWEDLAMDKEGNFYIGDFGNFYNIREDLTIYKIPNPDSISKQVFTGELIKFSLSDQSYFPPDSNKLEFDIKSMIHYNNHLYLFTKSMGIPFRGLVKTYKLTDTPGTHSAILIDSTIIGESKNMYEDWITGAAIHPDKKIMALLTHNKVIFYSDFNEDHFFAGKQYIMNLNHFSQKEAICFDIYGDQLIITDEKTFNVLGGNIYTIDVPYNKLDLE